MRKSRGRGPTLAKDINRQLVYKIIKQKVHTSRVEVAKMLHLNKNTVNSIVNELVAAGFVRDMGQQDTLTAGRKPIVIEFHADNKWAIGAQLTSTVIHWTVTDLYAKPVGTFSIPLNECTPDAVIEVLTHTVNLLMVKYNPADCIGLCIGVPGTMGPDRTRVIRSSHLNWHDVPLLALLEKSIALPLILDHSVRLASLGELWHGLGQGVDHFIYCNFGNGVGCSLIISRSIARGETNLAGELGHFVLEPDGPLCGCGNYGCLEALVGVPGFVRSASKTITSGSDSITWDWLLAEMFRQNKAVMGHFEQAARYIGHALSYVVNLLNPQFIICDGPLMQASPVMFPVIQAELQRMCLPDTYDKVRLERSRLYPWASCIGAAAAVIQKWEDSIDSLT